MKSRPNSLFARLSVHADEVATVCEYLVDALEATKWPAITRFSSPPETSGGRARTDSLKDALATEKALAKSREILWKHGDAITFRVTEHEGIEVRLTIQTPKSGDFVHWLSMSKALIAQLLTDDVPILSGMVIREGSGVACVPRLPLVLNASQVVVAHDDVLAWAFEQPKEALARGWKVETFGEYRLLSRALEVETNVELLKAIQDDQWAMARAANPGLTEYLLYDPEPEEKDIFYAGERTVRAAGYDPDDKTVIYSCFLEPDQHVHGWEVFSLKRILVEEKLHTGEEVATVQVAFPDQETAEREKRPLLDCGVEVLYYDADGEMVPLGEPVRAEG